MAIEKISIAQFLELAKQHPVLDVRSPGEYAHAHIPGAFNLPLFSDEERKAVGTAYKQQSRETAVKIGLEFFGVKMKDMVEEAEKIIANKRSPEKSTTAGCLLVHCWRGGMRSAGVAWLLDLYGFKVYSLVGGYKAYRKWVLTQFEKEYPFIILGGYTGSGKTPVLHQLEKGGQVVVDLEGLAHHKGSAFGAFGELPQPKQEMFENLLAGKLWLALTSMQVLGAAQIDQSARMPAIWLEDESQRIGNLQIPMMLWYQMRKSPVCFLDIPFEARLDYLVQEYGKIEKEKLVNAVIRIQKRLGGLETKHAINFLIENNHRECFRILLNYYDKWYGKALYNRENISALLNKIPCTGVDTETNIKKLLACIVVVSA